MVASQLLAAWFIDALGERLTYTVIAVVFLLGSWLCYLGPNMNILILGRVIQGIPAGIIQPLMMSVISVLPLTGEDWQWGFIALGY